MPARRRVELAGLLTKQSSYLHTADIDQTPLCKIQPHSGQVRLNYRILDTLIAPGPGVIDHQSISNEYYPIPNKISSIVENTIYSFDIYTSMWNICENSMNMSN